MGQGKARGIQGARRRQDYHQNLPRLSENLENPSKTDREAPGHNVFRRPDPGHSTIEGLLYKASSYGIVEECTITPLDGFQGGMRDPLSIFLQGGV